MHGQTYGKKELQTYIQINVGMHIRINQIKGTDKSTNVHPNEFSNPELC